MADRTLTGSPPLFTTALAGSRLHGGVRKTMGQTYAGGNRLLDALSAAERERVCKTVEIVDLTVGQQTHEPGKSYEWVVFPIDAVLSIVAYLANGDTCEIGMVGNEAASGVEIAFGAPVLRTTMCQVAGRAARLQTTVFVDAISRNPGLDALIRATEKARMFFLEQMIVCNAIHPVDQRCARWMLLVADRAGREEYPFTQEFLSIMLGVRRPSVSDAAARLQNHGAITYSRGNVRIVNRAKLESLSCECYVETTQMFDASLKVWGKVSRLGTLRAAVLG